MEYNSIDFNIKLQNQDDKIKNLNSFWNYFNCDCGALVSRLSDIANTPSCNAGISDIEDNVGLIDYYELSGKHICELEQSNNINKSDLLLVSNGPADNLSSFKLSYSQLSAQLLKDVFKKLKTEIGTISFDYKYNYSISSHNHDNLYSRVEYEQHDFGRAECIELAKISISTDCIDEGKDYLLTSDNPTCVKSYKNEHIVKMKKIDIPLPPKPMIGTLKIIGVPTIQKLIESENIVLDSTGLQVKIYDSDNHVLDDFDGWVFPNGSDVQNIDNALSSAAKTYASNLYAKSITLPNMNGFFKPIAYVQNDNTIVRVPLQIGMPQHNHSSDRLFTGVKTYENPELVDKDTTFPTGSNWQGFAPYYIHNGKYDTVDWSAWHLYESEITTSEFSDFSTESTGSDDEPYPKHQILPVMIYIGGETKQYYENLYAKYNRK